MSIPEAPPDLRAGWGDVGARLAFARRVREPLRFLGREFSRRHVVGRYRLRDHGGVVHLRHNTGDIVTFDEVVVQGIYDPPAPVVAALVTRSPGITVLDLGGNIGLFGVDALARYDVAEMRAFEPDPESAAVLQRTAAASRLARQWLVEPVAAAAADGSLAFVPGHWATSHAARPGEAGAITVAARDVLPLVAACDFLKVDVEGGEWPILTDPRFARGGPAAVALEYHAAGCPGDDPTELAVAAVEAAGLTVSTPQLAPDGRTGTLWAWLAA